MRIFPSKRDQEDRDQFEPAGSHWMRNNSDEGGHVTIFSGFVSYQMVREAFDAGRFSLGSLLSFSHSTGKADKLYMKGPGGRGEVEVAVSGVEDQSQDISRPSSPIFSKSGFGFATIAKRASSFASVARQAYAAASKNVDDEMLPLNCCLMSISLPWEHIAYDLLLKFRDENGLSCGAVELPQKKFTRKGVETLYPQLETDNAVMHAYFNETLWSSTCKHVNLYVAKRWKYSEYASTRWVHSSQHLKAQVSVWNVLTSSVSKSFAFSSPSGDSSYPLKA
ncbi:hypothetical protein KSS87_011044 [Heliosperma pusillum]|nr:hypothetical protein KSS87_011044 [Heliosperma pusillum]